MEIAAPGTYVLMEDVIAAIREYAQSLDDPHSGGIIHELATWLGGGEHPREAVPLGMEALGFEPKTTAVAGTDAPPLHPAEDSDPFDLEHVYRVELYPHPPDDPKPKWYARSVDNEGNILWTSNGAFDYEYVHKTATERWPGKPIFQGHGWSYDSVFLEHQEKKAFPTAAPMRERVSPKRMFA